MSRLNYIYRLALHNLFCNCQRDLFERLSSDFNISNLRVELCFTAGFVIIGYEFSADVCRYKRKCVGGEMEDVVTLCNKKETLNMIAFRNLPRQKWVALCEKSLYLIINNNQCRPG